MKLGTSGVLALLALATTTTAQTVAVNTRVEIDLGRATHVVVPQTRGFALRPGVAEVAGRLSDLCT